MDVEFRNEIKRGHRFISLLAVPFFAFIATVLGSFFGIFSSEARDLIASVLQGDLSRSGDLLAYMAIVGLCIGGTGIVVIGSLYSALFKPDHIVTISPERRMVDVQFHLPWREPRSASYRFDEIEAVELKYDDEQNEILLRLPDRRRPLILTREFRPWAAEAKLRQLNEMGLTSK